MTNIDDKVKITGEISCRTVWKLLVMQDRSTEECACGINFGTMRSLVEQGGLLMKEQTSHTDSTVDFCLPVPEYKYLRHKAMTDYYVDGAPVNNLDAYISVYINCFLWKSRRKYLKELERRKKAEERLEAYKADASAAGKIAQLSIESMPKEEKEAADKINHFGLTADLWIDKEAAEYMKENNITIDDAVSYVSEENYRTPEGNACYLFRAYGISEENLAYLRERALEGQSFSLILRRAIVEEIRAAKKRKETAKKKKKIGKKKKK